MNTELPRHHLATRSGLLIALGSQVLWVLMGGLVVGVGCGTSARCPETERVAYSHRVDGVARPLRVEVGQVLSLDPRTHPGHTGTVCLDLNGDGDYELAVESDQLPVLMTVDETTPSVIHLATELEARPVALEVVDSDAEGWAPLWRKNSVLEVITSNICEPCVGLDAFLHTLMSEGVHPTGALFAEGAFVLVKHHEHDSESYPVATARAAALRETIGNPYSYADGKTEIYGWAEEPGDIEYAIATSMAQEPQVAMEGHAWFGCPDEDDCVDVTLNVHLGDHAGGDLRVHIMVTENGISPGYPNAYFETNDYVSVAGTQVDLAPGSATVIHIDRDVVLMRNEGDERPWEASQLSVVVFVEDLADCSDVLNTRCSILNGAAFTLDGQPGQGSDH